MTTIRMPSSDAAASLYRSVGRPYVTGPMRRPSGKALAHAAARTCDPCQRLPGHFGVGVRSCCERVFKWNPNTRQLEWVWECDIETCTPSMGTLRMRAFA
jgi:hypothetical protein